MWGRRFVWEEAMRAPRNLLPLVLLFTAFYLAPSVALGYSICGRVTYWDARVDRDDSSGSRLTFSSDYKNQAAESLKILVYDEDGDCHDFDAGCGETDDDFLGLTYTNSSGFYCVDGVPASQQVYLMTDYSSSWNARVVDSAGNSVLRTSYGETNVNGNETIDWSITCFGSPFGECSNDSHSLAYPTERAYSHIYATMEDVWDRWGSSVVNFNYVSGGFHAYYPGMSNSNNEWGVDPERG